MCLVTDLIFRKRLHNHQLLWSGCLLSCEFCNELFVIKAGSDHSKVIFPVQTFQSFKEQDMQTVPVDWLLCPHIKVASLMSIFHTLWMTASPL